MFNKVFPQFTLGCKLPNPLNTKITADIEYKDVLNYFSDLNSH
jgi:hypothetical protein